LKRKIRVGLVGYGSQGRRIAYAITAQPDMTLTGVALKLPDVTARMALHAKHPLYAVDDEGIGQLGAAQIPVRGTLEGLLDEVDVVVDASPAGLGHTETYRDSRVKAIILAGEPMASADIPVFLSPHRYNAARSASIIRIPTPVTAGLARTLLPLKASIPIQLVNCTSMLAGAEPMRGVHGPLEAVTPVSQSSLQLVQSEFSHLLPSPLIAAILRIPAMLLSVQVVTVQFKDSASIKEVLEVWRGIPRILLVKGKQGLASTDAIFEYARRLRGGSGDLYEVCPWLESVSVHGSTLSYIQAVDIHSVTTPDIIDGIRALHGVAERTDSLSRTNDALRIIDSGVHP